MALYSIRIWDVANIVKLREVERRTAPSAWLAYRKALYDVLEGFGKLDTQIAHTLVAEAINQEDILPIGEQRSLNVSNTGCSVTIVREA